jgi:hypothetical protein
MDLGIGAESLLNPNEWVDSSELFGQGSSENNGNSGGHDNGGTGGSNNQENQDKNNGGNGGENPDILDNGNSTTEVVDTSSNLFGGQSSESVGSGDNNGDNGGSSNQNGGGSSTQTDVISSFAQAMREDGYLQNLTDEDFKGIKDAHSMAEAIKKEVQAQLTQEQLRIKQALDGGVDANEINQYHTAIENLNSITDEIVEADNEQSKTLRMNLIYKDYLNKGIPAEKAKTLTMRSVEAGTDKEDAKEALQANKEYFQKKYDDLLKGAEDKQKESQTLFENQAKELKTALLDTEEVFKGFKMDAQTRQKAYDAVTKPVFQTKDGRQLTEVQKFAEEHPVEFRKALGAYFVLTNGFQGIGNLLNKEVKKQVQSHLKSFDEKLHSRPSGGSMSYMEGDRGGAGESLFAGGWLLDTGK